MLFEIFLHNLVHLQEVGWITISVILGIAVILGICDTR